VGCALNERITLRFIEYDETRARMMLDFARRFAVEKPDGPPGERHGTAYVLAKWACYVHWTRGRTVVARELATGRVS
jgi:hypothetical protein